MEKKIDKALSDGEKEASQGLFKLVEEVNKTRKGRGRKAMPTDLALKKLLNCVADETRPLRTRRWAGLVLKSFIHELNGVKDQVFKHREEISTLGRLLFHDSEELRLIVASLICSLAATADGLPNFWPKHSFPSSGFSNFPLGIKYGRTWAVNLSDFYAQVTPGRQRELSQNLSTTFSALAVEIDGSNAIAADEAVYCIIQDGFTVTFNPPSHRKPFFLDIPITNIAAVATLRQSVWDSQGKSQQEVPVLEVRLNSKAANHTLNTEQRRARVVKIFSTSSSELESAANVLTEALKESQIPPVSSMSQSFDATRTPNRLKRTQMSPVLSSKAVAPIDPGPAAILLTTGPVSADTHNKDIAVRKTTQEFDTTRRPAKMDGSPIVAPPPNEAVPNDHLQSAERETTGTKRRKAQRAPGNLAGLGTLLSPEPEEPVATPHVTSSALRNSNPAKSSRARIAKSKPPGRKPATARKSTSLRTTVQNDLRPKPSSVRVKNTIRVANVQDSEDIYSALESDSDTGEGKANSSKQMKQTEKRPYYKPRKGKGRASVENEGAYKASQNMDRIPESTYASTRSKRPAGTPSQPKQLKTSATAADSSAKAVKPTHVVEQTLPGDEKDVREDEVGHENTPLLHSQLRPAAHVPSAHQNQPIDRQCYADAVEKFEVVVMDYEPVDTSIGLTAAAPQRSNRSRERRTDTTGASSSNPIQVSSDKSSSDDESDTKMGRQIKADPVPRPRLAQSLETTKEKSRGQKISSPSVHLEALVDERSARKANFVSFAKTGPKNQGRKSDPRDSSRTFGSPRFMRSSPPAVKGLAQRVVLQNHRTKPILDEVSHIHETQPTMKLPGYQIGEETQKSTPKKRGQWCQPPTSARKRKRLSQEELDGEDFIPIEEIERLSRKRDDVKPMEDILGEHMEGIEQFSRRASQSVRITDDGSPIPEDGNDMQDVSPFSQQAENATSSGQMFGKGSVRRKFPTGFSQPDAAQEPGQRLSSNSKSQPLSPFVDSQAISEYAPQRVVDALVNQPPKPSKNPFFGKLKANNQPQPAFLQHLARKLGTECGATHLERRPSGAEPEAVLIGDEEEGDYLSSSSSDTIIEQEVTEPSFLSKEEVEWESALQPRHRSILDILRRTSHRLVKHLINSETAVNHVIDDFVKDAEFIVDELNKKRVQQNERGSEASRAGQPELWKKYREVEGTLKEGRFKIRVQVRAGVGVWKEVHETALQEIQKLEVF